MNINNLSLNNTPLTLRPSLRNKALLLCVCGAFVAGGIWIFPTHPFFGALALMGFGLGFAVAAVGFIPNSFYLRLSEEGFTMVSFFRKHFVPWECVESFRPIKLGLNTMVGWNYAAEYKLFGSYAPANLRLAGAEAALPDRYGMSAEQLCALMNEAKQQSARQVAVDKISALMLADPVSGVDIKALAEEGRA